MGAQIDLTPAQSGVIAEDLHRGLTLASLRLAPLGRASSPLRGRALSAPQVVITPQGQAVEGRRRAIGMMEEDAHE